MIVGTTEIKTPEDHAGDYDPAWRHMVAMVSEADRKEWGGLLPDDRFITAQRQYLASAGTPEFERKSLMMMRMQKGDSLAKSVLMANRIYNSAGTSQVKDRLEALLLCADTTYARIAPQFKLTPDQVSTYEKLFFNVRGADGMVDPAYAVRDYFALRGAPDVRSPADQPAYWRKLALTGGAARLVSLWGWGGCGIAEPYSYVEMQARLLPELFEAMNRKVAHDMLDGRSLADAYSNAIRTFAEMQRDGILSNSDRVTADSLLHQILAMAGRPGRIAPDEAQKARMQAELESKRRIIEETGNTPQQAAKASLDHITQQLKEIDHAR